MNKVVAGHIILAALLGTGRVPVVLADCNPSLPIIKPDSRYLDHGDGTVTDTVTGLMWKQCEEGRTTVSSACDTGEALTFTWQAALQRSIDVNTGSAGETLGYTDWRLPNINELKSLVETACYNPAINTTLFPGTLYPGVFWSSSPNTYADNSNTLNYQSGFAWRVNFADGMSSDWGGKWSAYRVRLVRGGQ